MKSSPRNRTPARIAAKIRGVLKDGGTAKRAAGVQRFFKEEIESHGWRTAELRRVARQMRREIIRDHGLESLLEVADELFSGSVLEEKIAAVFLLEKLDAEFGDREFELFESWLDRINNWSEHDALVHDLIAPLFIAQPTRVKTALRWA